VRLPSPRQDRATRSDHDSGRGQRARVRPSGGKNGGAGMQSPWHKPKPPVKAAARSQHIAQQFASSRLFAPRSPGNPNWAYSGSHLSSPPLPQLRTARAPVDGSRIRAPQPRAPPDRRSGRPQCGKIQGSRYVPPVGSRSGGYPASTDPRFRRLLPRATTFCSKLSSRSAMAAKFCSSCAKRAANDSRSGSGRDPIWLLKDESPVSARADHRRVAVTRSLPRRPGSAGYSASPLAAGCRIRAHPRRGRSETAFGSPSPVSVAGIVINLLAPSLTAFSATTSCASNSAYGRTLIPLGG